ncbi:MAG TPA: putative baseplate assembly protein [Candidatus Elarobacter sp.]|jgi:hypothetical protein
MNERCGCCTGTHAVVPVSELNPPGLAAIAYRAGTYATFLETMLAKLTSLPKLTTRDASDPSIALLDAWAVVADVLTFYQERIANEGYLETARERRSVLELARLIGYRLRPGVAASVRLAFSVATGFSGIIPAGTRAQSIPGAGESPQFFETSTALEMRDVWNVLAPRLTRPQVITPALPLSAQVPNTPGALVPPPPAPISTIPVTGADIIDTIYLDGIATGLRPGDAVFFIFGNAAGEQYLRLAQSVDPQAAAQRTLVTLALDPRYGFRTLELFVEKAKYLFPGSDIAKRVVTIVGVLIDNIRRHPNDSATAVLSLRAAVAELALQRQLADARGFTRVSAFLGQMQRTLTLGAVAMFVLDPGAQQIPTGTGDGEGDGGGDGGGETPAPYTALPVALAGSQLERLDAVVGALGVQPSVQPANALRLHQTVAQSFTSQSDAAPRLLAALNPQAASSLYQAWSAVATPSSRVRVFAARVRATLFASSFAGAFDAASKTKPYTAPTILSAWSTLGMTGAPLSVLALDAPYEHIAPGTWIAVDRPDAAATGRTTTFHSVVSARTAGMDTTTGFSAKVTILTLDSPWLSDASLGTTTVLRQTVVYAQAEPLVLAEEPLDTDVEGDVLDLGDVYAGIEPGRWIIVSGNRTDVPGASGVAASELAMIASVAQGSQAPLCIGFPFATPPFATVHYTTSADVNGDRLVVGELEKGALKTLRDSVAAQQTKVANRRYCDQVELGAGTYANAYVPSDAELNGQFPSFQGMLVDPVTKSPLTKGIEVHDGGLFAWRIAEDKLHTILTLATPLAYTYDRGTVTIYGNVVDATHGQSTGEVLGNGAASRVFQSFVLGQSPLTYLSAPTPSGIDSTLSVQVNELLWHEAADLGGARPPQRVYVTREDDAHKTSVTFGNGAHGARLPSGTANVKASYRYGLGKAGNVAAGQISQLATHPLGAQGVVNPLPARGGADPDRIDQARANAPLAVKALDRLVSVRDYADFTRTYAGIGKAAAARISDGRRQLVHVTVAGVDDVPVDPGSDLYRNLLASLRAFGDPFQPVAVGARRLRLLVMSAAVGLEPDFVWEDVAPAVRGALLARFAFDARELGRSAFLSEAVRTAQDVPGVAYVTFSVFDSVGESITAVQLGALGKTLTLREYVQAEGTHVDPAFPAGDPGRIAAAELVFLTPDVPDTLILSEAGS